MVHYGVLDFSYDGPVVRLDRAGFLSVISNHYLHLVSFTHTRHSQTGFLDP